MIDLRFGDYKVIRTYECQKCPKPVKDQRKCGEDGFDNLKRPRKMDDYSIELNFCPGKATWYPEIADLFEKCRIAYEVGILPKKGLLEDQPELFADVFPFFVDRWVHRKYYKVWHDVAEFTPSVLNAIGKMISKMFGGK